MMIRIALFALTLLGLASTVDAAVITWQFSGAVSLNGGPFSQQFAGIPLGLPATMDFVFDPLTPNTANCGPGMGFYALGNAVALTLGGRQYGATAFVESNNGAANCIPTGGEVEMRLAWGAPTIVDAALAAQYPALWTTVGPGGFQFTLDDWMRLPHADQLGGLPTTLNPNPFPTTVHIFNGSTNQRLNIDGQLTDGQLTAVPEPTSLVLFGTGSALLLARRRRR